MAEGCVSMKHFQFLNFFETSTKMTNFEKVDSNFVFVWIEGIVKFYKDACLTQTLY